jgi:RNA polymerase sigma-70 factor, ECF subfamily
MTLDERRLTARIRAGEPQAFQDLYDAYGARAYGYALRLTGSREEAEDLVQEVFLAAYEGRAGYQGRARLISWLLGIATRKWRDRCRRHSAVTVPLEEESLIGQMGTAGPMGPMCLEKLVLDRATLESVLGRLEPPFREALLLVRSQGLTYAEAAGATGEPEGTVKWRVAEATRRAQTILNGMEGAGTPAPCPPGLNSGGGQEKWPAARA